MPRLSLRFDKQDKLFLAQINGILEMNVEDRAMYFSALHPNGIIELAVPTELRIASAVLHLLGMLREGQEQERLDALSALRDEVLVSARTTLRHNTGRVLIQIMKDIVRAHGDEERQLHLAHDFRQAAAGKPSVVRKLLRRYYLLEMPEEWNQEIFDHHVHDANTKGRKTATHLIMDAWVKGIRSLTVIYYNYVGSAAARELLCAAEIMGVNVRIGLLFHAPFRGRLVDFIWIPRGFADIEDFLGFLGAPPMRHLMEEGRKASQWLEIQVLHILDGWNAKTRLALASLLGGEPEPLDSAKFLQFVGRGQASLLHLAEHIHRHLYPLMRKRAHEIEADLVVPDLGQEQKRELQRQLQRLDALTSEVILEELNSIERNPEIAAFCRVSSDPACPEILRLSPLVLLDWLTSLHSGNRVILNLAELTPEDVLNLLWDCQGLITHLELFNLKDWQEGKASYTKSINDLQRAINDGSAPRLKQIIRAMIRDCMDEDSDQTESRAYIFPESSERDAMSQLAKDLDGQADVLQGGQSVALPPDFADSSPGIVVSPHALPSGSNRPDSSSDCAAREAKLRTILRSMPILMGFYKKSKLHSRLGTDSTSRPGRRYGMGLVFPETLPAKAQRELSQAEDSSRLRLPLRTELLEHVTYHTSIYDSKSKYIAFVRRLPFLRHFGKQRQVGWQANPENTIVCNEGMCSTGAASTSADQGNIYTLGGMGRVSSNGFLPEKRHGEESSFRRIRYVNSLLVNLLKVLVGFIPAMIAFQMTQENWVLAWLGAPIWFLITGLRNIVQAVQGGGGFRRSPLLRWNSYVSWSRLCDSLMFTGFSVVLLELLVRRLFLADLLGVTTATNAVLSFTVISLVNGCYLVGHNYLRGLQREAIIWNMFRSVLAIPVALLYNALFQAALVPLFGVAAASALLLSSAAIISKLASDTVAAVIEGRADRNSNIRLRMWDYSNKLKQVFDLYAQLETLYPEQGVLEMLHNPKDMLQELQEKNNDLRKALIINALDLMYFWFYQPRASYALRKIAQDLSGAERLVLLRSQQPLIREREVSQMLVDGLVGRDFAGALAFYLDRHREYLRNIEQVCLGRGSRKLAARSG